MRADKYIELHDRECPRCDNTPFRIVREYDQIRHTPGRTDEIVVGDPFCSDCGRRLEPVDLPLEMSDGWSVITR